MPERLPISAVIVAYHGEATIGHCLRSIADLVDEIIVVHDGPCQDHTLDIARQYTSNIFIRPHVGIPEPHRAFTYQTARHDWIFQIDQDEFLSDDVRHHLAELVRTPAAEGYEFAWPTLYRGNYYTYYSKRALFNRRHFYFIGAPSEHIKARDASVRIQHLPYRLEHRPPYNNLTFSTFRRKWIPWAKLQAEYAHKEFRTIPTYNYSANDWDHLTKMRLKHPLLLGMIGMSIYNLLLGIRDFIRTRRWLFLKAGLLHSLFQLFLYYYVWSARRC